MAVSAPERQYLLGQVSQLAANDLTALWGQAETLSSADFFTYMVQAFPDLVDPYHQAAGQLAATWFEESLPASPYIAKVVEPLTVERLVSSAQWALGADGTKALDRLGGTLQRAVFDGARETTWLNVEATNTAWARYASANACAFCRLLSTRGADYKSQKTAATKVHDHCSCIPVEDRDGSYQPPDYIERWQSEYTTARAESGSGDHKQILASWRTQGIR